MSDVLVVVVKVLLVWSVLSVFAGGVWIAWHEVEYYRNRLRARAHARRRRGWLPGRGRV